MILKIEESFNVSCSLLIIFKIIYSSITHVLKFTSNSKIKKPKQIPICLPFTVEINTPIENKLKSVSFSIKWLISLNLSNLLSAKMVASSLKSTPEDILITHCIEVVEVKKAPKEEVIEKVMKELIEERKEGIEEIKLM